MNSMIEWLTATSKRRWVFRLLIAVLLGLGGLFIWQTYSVIPQIQKDREQLEQLYSLESTVLNLRILAHDSIFNAVHLQLKKGAYSSWHNVATWLEEQRRFALQNGVVLGWDIDTLQTVPAVSARAVPLYKIPMQLWVVPLSQDFETNMRYVQNMIQDTSQYLSVQSIHFRGDSTGVLDSRIQLEGWLYQNE
jgi:hypothetical protein